MVPGGADAADSVLGGTGTPGVLAGGPAGGLTDGTIGAVRGATTGGVVDAVVAAFVETVAGGLPGTLTTLLVGVVGSAAVVFTMVPEAEATVTLPGTLAGPFTGVVWGKLEAPIALASVVVGP